jgi:hypothetical protein
LTRTEGDAKLVVDGYGVTLREEIDGGIFLLGLVEGLQHGKIYGVNGHIVKRLIRRIVFACGADDSCEYGRLVGTVIWVGGQDVGHDGREVDGIFQA